MGSTHFRPKEIAEYYDLKNFALDSDLQRLKEDSIEFFRLNDSHRHNMLDQSPNNSIIKFIEPAEKLHYPTIDLKIIEVDAVDADELAAKEIREDHIALEITPKMNEKNKGLTFSFKGSSPIKVIKSSHRRVPFKSAKSSLKNSLNSSKSRTDFI